MKSSNMTFMSILTVPYKVGIAGGLISAAVTIPLCFDLNTALWFNECYVTTDVPEGKDLETWLEVGSWTWNWMEPPLGQASFFLLALQFARAQFVNLDYRPYTGMLKEWRANRLAGNFPKYHTKVDRDYSFAVGLRGHE